MIAICKANFIAKNAVHIFVHVKSHAKLSFTGLEDIRWTTTEVTILCPVYQELVQLVCCCFVLCYCIKTMSRRIHAFLYFLFDSTYLLWCQVYCQVQNFINTLSLFNSLDDLTTCICFWAKFFYCFKLGSCIIVCFFGYTTVCIWDTCMDSMMVNNNSRTVVIKFSDFTGWTRNVHCRCTTAVANVLTTLKLKLYPVSFGVLTEVWAVIIDTLR